MIFVQVMSPNGLGDRFCEFLTEKLTNLVRGDSLRSPNYYLTFIFMFVGFCMVGGANPIIYRTIDLSIDYVPTGAAFIIGGRLDVSPASLSRERERDSDLSLISNFSERVGWTHNLISMSFILLRR
eukprot:TRINITY_DN10995_c0_g1_i4.p1 TRINITY_DN10995_c0_g1~~TRINITY_DN10995_c0_g1_i4.p1  ORF type:complete len:126 (-),score=11.69 TRINITY_DN10995_c0_g1_i4:219-596(-)